DVSLSRARPAVPFRIVIQTVQIRELQRPRREVMRRTRPKLFAASAALIAIALAGSTRAGAPLPSLESGDLAQGPWAAMHMLLQKTVLNINVATIDVRFDKGTQGRFAQIATGKGYSPDLGHQLALAALDAKHAVVEMKFKRDIPLNRWIGVVKDNLE